MDLEPLQQDHGPSRTRPGDVKSGAPGHHGARPGRGARIFARVGYGACRVWEVLSLGASLPAPLHAMTAG